MSANRRRTMLAVVLGVVVGAGTPVRAQMTVFDPSNYSQNILTAARALQQVNNGIQSLQNEAMSLINQARNLASLPYSALEELQQSIGQTQQLLAQTQRIAYDVSAIDQAFTRAYPQNYTSATSSPQLLTDAQTRWQNSLAGFQDTLRVQAGVIQNLDRTRAEIGNLVSSSQSAEGALQAAQSGNQLIALQTNQLADLTAGMASIARAQSLESARAVASQVQARQQMERFLNYGSGYQAQTVRMFH
jgi:type IV secretion system protein TrbJ